MLVERSRSVGPLAPSATSPVPRHHLDLPADLSPRSSSSSLLSSNESLLNTSLSVPSPAKESGNSPGGFSALQRLQYALESSSLFSTYFHETDNEHLEQQIGKPFPSSSLGSPTGSLLNSSNPKDDSDEAGEEMMMMQDDDHREHHAPSPQDGNAMGVVSSPTGSPNSTSNNNNLANTIFQCPLCAVVCNSRHDFNEHLVTHSQQHACPKCDFITNTDDLLRDHVHEAHGADDVVDMLSHDEVKTPKTNAQGKLKTFKCKHCEHRAVTKKEFWDHTKSHIRQEKMLHCPKCPFVTEYKHHLEYHLRNHFNSKPYQCNKCSYSCVNKSMLNSHLKSHSNVYQYRCSDCSYATKYCHSLKLHLRKYNHNPAMVLNPDGTPNPLPIIDVYGTRRGPKIKRPDPNLEGLATTTPVAPSPNKPTKGQRKQPGSTPIKKEKAEKQRQQLDARDLSPKLASSPRYVSSMPNQSITPPLKRMRTESGDSETDLRMPSHPMMQNAKVPQLPQAPISPSSIALILQQSGLDQRKEMGTFPHQSPNPLEFYNAALNQYLLNPMFHMAAGSPLNDLAHQMASDQQTKLLAQLLQSRMMQPQQMHQPQQQQLNVSVANDLRAKKHVDLSRNGMAVAPSPLDLSKNEDSVMGEDLKKRKRKGKALRYERRFSEEEEQEEEALDFSNNNNNAFQVNRERKGYDGPTDLSVPNYMCKYCEITFPEKIVINFVANYAILLVRGVRGYKLPHPFSSRINFSSGTTGK